MSWVNDLDALASAGVIAYDAPAYIRGTQPRYVGNPPLEGLSDQLPAIKPQPSKDGFDNSNAVKNPSWKKWLFGALLVTGSLLGLSKLKNVNFKNITKLPSKVWNFIVNKFKRTP